MRGGAAEWTGEGQSSGTSSGPSWAALCRNFAPNRYSRSNDNCAQSDDDFASLRHSAIDRAYQRRLIGFGAHLQAANIDRLKDIRGKRVAEFVQVPVLAARGLVTFVGALHLRRHALAERVDGIFAFAVPAVQPGAECNFLAQYEQAAVGLVARAIIRPRGMGRSREYEKGVARLLAIAQDCDQ